MFKLREHQTTPLVEISAGITIFCAMVYVLAANPAILGGAGAPAPALFTATALAAICGSLIMALLANLPFAVAPGMGINAIFAFVVIKAMASPGPRRWPRPWWPGCFFSSCPSRRCGREF